MSMSQYCLDCFHCFSSLMSQSLAEKIVYKVHTHTYSPYKAYLFDTKHLLLRLVAADIDVLDLNHLVNETKFFVVKPFPAVKFPMDQGCQKSENYDYKYNL